MVCHRLCPSCCYGEINENSKTSDSTKVSRRMDSWPSTHTSVLGFLSSPPQLSEKHSYLIWMFGGAKTQQWACIPRHIVSAQGPRPGLMVCWSFFEFLIISEQEIPCFPFAQRLRLIANSITYPWFLRHQKVSPLWPLTVAGSNGSPAPALTYKLKIFPNCVKLWSFLRTWIILSSLSCGCWGPKWENDGESNKSLSPVFLLKPWSDSLSANLPGCLSLSRPTVNRPHLRPPR